ncbi:MAG: hypothetical protein AB1722_10790 [Pseudomonadota bacterium]
MTEESGIRVSWRAALVPSAGARAIHGRLAWVGKQEVMVKAEHHLPPGADCHLVLMLPKLRPEESNQFVEGPGRVISTVLSGHHFFIKLQWQEIAGQGHALLDERMQHHRRMWDR